MNKPMTIGQVAKATNISVETIRFYEQRQLIPAPTRAANGYRHYDDTAIKHIHFIQRAKMVGFSLAETRELLALRNDQDSTCATVRSRAEQKIADIENKMAELQRMKQALQKLADNCPGKGPVSDCPILDSFSSDALAESNTEVEHAKTNNVS